MLECLGVVSPESAPVASYEASLDMMAVVVESESDEYSSDFMASSYY